MKGKLIACSLVLIAVLMVIGIAIACEDRPPEPVCPAGQITDAPAQWVDGVRTCPTMQFSASRQVRIGSHDEYRTRTATVSCPTDDDAYFHISQGNRTCSREFTYTRHGHTYTYTLWANSVTTYGDWSAWSLTACNTNHGDTCQRRSVDDYETQTFGPIDVVYGIRSQDPNHCHRPTGSSLGVPSWAMSAFNQLPEHVDGTYTPGYWIDPVCRIPDPTATPTEEPTLEPTPEDTPEPTPTDVPPIEPTPTEQPPLEPTPTIVPEYVCQPGEFIWVWQIQGQDGRWHLLRDRGYDGTYDAPSLIQQRYYFGCDFYPARVWGYWVSDCDADYQYWNTLPAGNCGGACPLS